MNYTFADIKKLFIPYETAYDDIAYYQKILEIQWKKIWWRVLEIWSWFWRQTKELLKNKDITSLDCLEVDEKCLSDLHNIQKSSPIPVHIIHQNCVIYIANKTYDYILATSHILPFLSFKQLEKTMKSLYVMCHTWSYLLLDLRNPTWYQNKFHATQQYATDNKSNKWIRKWTVNHISANELYYSVEYSCYQKKYFEESMHCYLHDINFFTNFCINVWFKINWYWYKKMLDYSSDDRFIVFVLKKV